MRRRQNVSSGALPNQGRRNRQTSSRPSSQAFETSTTGWAKLDKMKTAYAEMDSQRQASVATANQEYLGRAPKDPSLIHASLVIPGGNMLPQGLDDPEALNDIRAKHKVWIHRPKPNIFEICGRDIRQLQNAVKALNWKLHDMRLSSEALTTQFLAQKPSKEEHGVIVNVELDARPVVKALSDAPRSVLKTALDLSEQLRGSLLPSTDILRLMTTNLRMRVNFGRVQVRTRKKGLGNNMPYASFAEMVPQFSSRGGAGLQTRLRGVAHAATVLQRIVDPIVGLYHPREHSLSRRCTVMLEIGDHELMADAKLPAGEKTQLSIPTLVKPDARPRLNWTVVAPDMSLDWNFQVDSRESKATIPDSLLKLMQSIVLIPDKTGVDDGYSLCPPRLLAGHLGSDRIDKTTLKTSIIVPFRGTPFDIEVSVTKQWQGLRTVSNAETWWGLEFYCRGWDEAINNVSPGQSRKDWGAELERIWPGADQSLEERFTAFLEYIVEIQSALDDVNFRSR
ncbi:hypothetical protein JDV02_001791 [Purpureocillium takamizusanense]|uniref:Uncharacterized protein n=1 Tax=Purpureocillium takamizusanense TaxID=2060973 RepID=A0A9Q8QA10_9HYPO|nr:uncharacterized protein JDV02_001791 [Purpureocillium takamizusanense]UNI15239.1 hypothetical protein JDV02_001791 [Purpureocillium takamizusanense]